MKTLAKQQQNQLTQLNQNAFNSHTAHPHLITLLLTTNMLVMFIIVPMQLTQPMLMLIMQALPLTVQLLPLVQLLPIMQHLLIMQLPLIINVPQSAHLTCQPTHIPGQDQLSQVLK
jgi:hypothetical protein